ncbi:MAG: TetR/AcrR family transcriptional regulator [Acholeplasmataceae bacterium]|nr:TetR/AcrR family transcriptional regulator [Acholeplasmataceae bacterium]
MQSTKEKILSVLISYIKDGVNLDNISLSTIAAEAEIGKSTLYEHFSSKEDMICETYKYLLSQYESILTSDIESMDFKGAFIEQIQKILTVMKDAKVLMDAIMNSHHEAFMKFDQSIPHHMKHIQEQMDKRFAGIIYLGIVEGTLEQKEPKPYIKNVIQAVVSGLLYQYVNKEIEISEDDLCELVFAHVLQLLK